MPHRSQQRLIDESRVSRGPRAPIPQRVRWIDARLTERAFVLPGGIDHRSNFDTNFGQLLILQGPSTSGNDTRQRALR